jgi:enhancing lycopene biosynthesis protein 2
MRPDYKGVKIMKKVGVILAGCGVMDGSEIHEATLTIYFLDKSGVEISFFAPDKDQMDVVDHCESKPLCGSKPLDEKRNVLKESARIARGVISPLSEIDIDSLDAIILPGGFGAAKNLTSFAVDGSSCDIDPDVAKVIKSAVEKKKAVGSLCIAPVVVARALKGSGIKPKLTIGTDEGVMQKLKEMDAIPIAASVSEIVVDEENKLVSTPAYMLGKSISEIAVGIEKLVKKILSL